MTPRVFMAAPCGKSPVCDAFYDCFYWCELPEGSVKQRAKGGSVPQNLNTIIDLAKNFTHVFIVEDDSMFAPDVVTKLLAHDKEVVTGLCLSRNPPFAPYIYSGVDDEGRMIMRSIEPSESGLIPVAGTGMGGILIKMSVFDRLKRPYFHHYFKDEVEWGQDIVFQKSLIEAGVEVYCDLDVTIWHATHCSVAMLRENDKWNKVIRVGNENFTLADGY